MELNPFGGLQGVDKGVVFVFGERAVDVVAFVLIALPVARGTEGNFHVDGFGEDDGGNGIEEKEVFVAA